MCSVSTYFQPALLLPESCPGSLASHFTGNVNEQQCNNTRLMTGDYFCNNEGTSVEGQVCKKRPSLMSAVPAVLTTRMPGILDSWFRACYKIGQKIDIQRKQTNIWWRRPICNLPTVTPCEFVERQTDRRTDGQKDRRTRRTRQTDRQAERQTDRQSQIDILLNFGEVIVIQFSVQRRCMQTLGLIQQ